MFKLPCGFITASNGNNRHQSIEVGQLTKLLINNLGKELEFNLLTGEPEIKRHPIDTNFVENFYIPLSEWGYRIRKGCATDSLLYASQKNSYHPVLVDLSRVQMTTKLITNFESAIQKGLLHN